MNKKLLLTLAPVSLLMGTLMGCKNTPSVFTVMFDTDGGTPINSVTVKKGEKVARPEVIPTKDGYAFTDWYVAKEGDTKFDFNTAINQNTTIYAHYKTLTEEEKFYVAYKEASDSFQNSDKGFDQYDVTYVVNGATQNIEKVYYVTEEGNERTCILKVVNDENEQIIAGGDIFKYYEDASKGIKAYVKDLKEDGYTFTFTIDNYLKTCSLTATKGETIISNTFNRHGYLTKAKMTLETNMVIEFNYSYSGEFHNPGKDVDATLTSGTYTASASNLVYRDLVRVTIDDASVASNSFDTIECPGYSIVDLDVYNDIRVRAIYDANFTKLKEDTDYIVEDGKITFKKARTAKTIIDLKVTNQTGIPNLIINACSKKILEATWSESLYLSTNAGSVSAGTVFYGTITYSYQDGSGFNGFVFSINELAQHDVGINNPNKTINVTKISKESEDITSSCTINGDIIYLPGSTLIKENLYITFTVTKSITSLVLVALNYNF